MKVPGTNKRLPRNRDLSEVITTERPDLRIIEDGLARDTHPGPSAQRPIHEGHHEPWRASSALEVRALRLC